MRPSFAYVIAVLVMGCGHTQRFASYDDQFYHFHIDELQRNRIQSAEEIYLNPQRFIDKNLDTSFALLVRIIDHSWCNIPPGRTLFLYADSSRIVLSGRGSEENRMRSFEGRREEIASYSVPRGELRKISYASDVTVRIEGLRCSAIGSLRDDNFEFMQAFCEQFCH